MSVYDQNGITVRTPNSVVNGDRCTIIGAGCVVNGNECRVDGNDCVVNGGQVYRLWIWMHSLW